MLSKPDVRDSYNKARRRVLRVGDGTYMVSSLTNNTSGEMHYDTQRIIFKQVQEEAASNWRDLKPKYKDEKWLRQDLNVRKSMRSRPITSGSSFIMGIAACGVFAAGLFALNYKYTRRHMEVKDAGK